jgi:hypothetical protein
LFEYAFCWLELVYMIADTATIETSARTSTARTRATPFLAHRMDSAEESRSHGPSRVQRGDVVV